MFVCKPIALATARADLVGTSERSSIRRAAVPRAPPDEWHTATQRCSVDRKEEGDYAGWALALLCDDEEAAQRRAFCAFAQTKQLDCTLFLREPEPKLHRSAAMTALRTLCPTLQDHSTGHSPISGVYAPFSVPFQPKFSFFTLFFSDFLCCCSRLVPLLLSRAVLLG